MRKQRANKRNH